MAYKLISNFKSLIQLSLFVALLLLAVLLLDCCSRKPVSFAQRVAK